MIGSNNEYYVNFLNRRCCFFGVRRWGNSLLCDNLMPTEVLMVPVHEGGASTIVRDAKEGGPGWKSETRNIGGRICVGMKKPP